MGRRAGKTNQRADPNADVEKRIDKVYQRNIQIVDLTRQRSLSSIYGGAPRTHNRASGKRATNRRQRAAVECKVQTPLLPDSPSANSESHEDLFAANSKDHGGTFADNFLATLERSVQQKKRDWVSTLLEMLIPILFIVGTIILWAAFGDKKEAEVLYYNPSDVRLGILATPYDSYICYNDSLSPLPNLLYCGASMSGANCSGDQSVLPAGVKSLCTLSGSYEAAIGAYLNSIIGYASTVPSLDTIIYYQWLTRMVSGVSSTDTAATTLSSSGLTDKTRYDAIGCSGNLYFVPNNNATQMLIKYFNTTSRLFTHVNGGTFETMAEANAFVKGASTYNWAVVEVKSFDANSFDVTIHMNSSALPSLTNVIDNGYPGGYQFDRGDMYLASGFSSIQKMIYDCYLLNVIGAEQVTLSTSTLLLSSFGTGPYTQKELLETASTLVAFILVLSFLYPVSQLAKRIVLEKELRIREAMLIMGLSNTSLYLSWFVMYALQYLVLCIILTILLKATYITYSNSFILFLTFYIFALTTIPLAGLIAAFFSKARLASLLAPLIFFALSVPVFAFTSASASVILGVSIFSPTAFASAITDILTLETGVGFAPGDFHSKRLDPTPYKLWIFLGADFFVYYLFMLYFDVVLPKDWGTTRSPVFFIVDPIRACCCKPNMDLVGTNEDGRVEDGVFEDVEDQEAAVNIVGLRKEYKRNGKKFCAVNNLYWAMKPREISVLLGHNGAGKSTCMNMITGMTTPDEGDCYVVGYSVRQQLQEVRQRIGFCPQHNILWPELTCREHLEYFGKIKGLRGEPLEEAVRIVLQEVDLLEKINQSAKSLSGGQKRKLSVAIAFVGRSPLVFLDEPTAGMDVGARRYTWELLRRMSESHTIMLTTHYMDEADLLGHRIGIMSRGRLQCSGSSMFLKSRLGVGYNMSVSLDPDADAEQVDNLVTSYVPSACASNFNGVEIIYKLPMKDIKLFPDLLSGLDEKSEAYGVRGYSLSATTLEEVFLQIALDDMNKDKKVVEMTEEERAYEDRVVWNCDLVYSLSERMHSQFRSSMAKRLWNAIRDRRMQCFQIVCPVFCILLAMLLTLVKFTKTGSTVLSADMFSETTRTDISNCEAHFGTVNGTVTQDEASYVFSSFRNPVDMSYYFIDTEKVHALPRYTSMFCDASDMYSIARIASSTVLFYNSSAYHSCGLALKQYYDLVLQNLTKNTSARMHTRISSMPQSSSDSKVTSGVQTILIGAIVMIPFTFLPSNPVAWVVKERECKARHLQNVSGLNFYIYWLTNFIFDIVAYLISLVLVIIIFVIFSRKEYVSSATIGPTFVMFITYGLCSTVAAYSISFAFQEHSSAQTITMAISFVTGFLLVMMVFILSLVESTKNASNKMRWPFRLVPSYCVGESIINLALEHQKVLLGKGTSAWSMDVIGWPCVYMAIEFPVFLFLTLFIDHPKRRQWGQKGGYHRGADAEVIADEDSDVEDERQAVYEQEEIHDNEDIVRVVDLRKVYKNGKVAVRNITFSILPDEVFGFLGTNGAGKTTAISILCQEFLPTSGSAYVCGYDVVEENMEALSCIGYCPQFDACLDLLTVEEHLYMYAGIRGIVMDQRKTVVTGLMRLCEIAEYAKTCSNQLSGGNRRKLSVAMSLIGSPQIVFLDEPSAGMDPVARRGLWTAIQKVSQNCSVVLTTHHLEEVEALADTVAIMADGALRCIGDKMHLKTKYGSGFEMSIRILDRSKKAQVEKFIKQAFPEAIFNEFKGQRFVYALPQDIKLSETFWTLQQNKERYGITDYSVSQTSIEQVFLRICEEQDAREKHHTGADDTKFAPSHAQLHLYGGNSTAERMKKRRRRKSDYDQEGNSEELCNLTKQPLGMNGMDTGLNPLDRHASIMTTNIFADDIGIPSNIKRGSSFNNHSTSKKNAQTNNNNNNNKNGANTGKNSTRQNTYQDSDDDDSYDEETGSSEYEEGEEEEYNNENDDARFYDDSYRPNGGNYAPAQSDPHYQAHPPDPSGNSYANAYDGNGYANPYDNNAGNEMVYDVDDQGLPIGYGDHYNAHNNGNGYYANGNPNFNNMNNYGGYNDASHANYGNTNNSNDNGYYDANNNYNDNGHYNNHGNYTGY